MKFRAILENLEKMEETDRRQKIREYNNILAEASERTAKSTSIVDFMLGTTGFLNFGSYLNTILNLLGLLKGVPDMMPGATERKDLQKFRSIAKELGTDNPEKTGEEVYLLDRIFIRCICIDRRWDLAGIHSFSFGSYFGFLRD